MATSIFFSRGYAIAVCVLSHCRMPFRLQNYGGSAFLARNVCYRAAFADVIFSCFVSEMLPLYSEEYLLVDADCFHFVSDRFLAGNISCCFAKGGGCTWIFCLALGVIFCFLFTESYLFLVVCF